MHLMEKTQRFSSKLSRREWALLGVLIGLWAASEAVDIFRDPSPGIQWWPWIQLLARFIAIISAGHISGSWYFNIGQKRGVKEWQCLIGLAVFIVLLHVGF